MIRNKEKTTILCVGDITPDVIIPYGETLKALSKLSSGEVLQSKPTLRPGGAMANTVTTLGKLGMNPYMLSGVGNDEYGEFLIDYFKGCGVRTEYIFRQKERMSLILAVIDKTGERVLYLYDGPGAKLPELEEKYIPKSLIPEVGWVHANGFANEVTVDLMEQCAAQGATVSFDLNLRCETFGMKKERKKLIMRAVNTSHVLLGSGAEEFAPLTGISDLRKAASFFATDGRVVVARDGHEPIHLFADGEYHKMPIIPTKVVNKVGGGDAFNGGFIAAGMMGLSAFEAVKWGCSCASSAISSNEPHFIPSREYIENMVKQYETI